MEYTKEGIIMYFKNKYNYINEMDLDIMYECAYDILLNLRYPTQSDMIEIPQEFMEKHKTWILRAMQEHIDREGMTNVLSYSENGVSITFDKTGLSKSLIQEITPLAKVGYFKV